MHTSTSEIFKILNPIRQLVVSDEIIAHICIDSRYITEPEKTLFVAIDGNKTAGANYVDFLIKSGVRNFIISEKYFATFKDRIANILFVENPLFSLQRLVEVKRNEYQFPIIGITGSNGKTIVKEWLSQIYQEKYTITKSPKSYNSQLGVPLSVWGIHSSSDLGIFEAGISQSNEMSALEKIIKPTIGILTNIGEAHQSNFSSKEEKLNEKLMLFLNSEILIVRKSIVDEYENSFNQFKSLNPKLKLITWGETDECEVKFEEKNKESLLNYISKNQSGSLTVSFSDFSFLENIKICVSTLIAMGESVHDFQSKIGELKSVEMRLELIPGQYDMTIVNDTYNADLDSLMIAIQYLSAQHSRGAKSIILSEILESEKLPIENIVRLLSNIDLERVILIGEKYKYYLSNFQAIKAKNIAQYDTTDEFMKYYPHNLLKENTVLIKGARRFQMENIVDFYREKMHSTYLKVHLNALKNNLNVFSSLLNKETKIMVMLKAQGYGLGSIELARMLETQRVDYFAVAYIDEGIELRNAGIQRPIMVMNSDWTALGKMIDYHLEPEIFSLDFLEKIVQELRSKKIEETVYVHLKLETGMHRLGIDEQEVEKLISIFTSIPNLKIKSIFSHLAASDDKLLHDFTNSQIEKFERITQKIIHEIGYKPMRHILNTGGIINNSSAQYDMVRLGIGMFGFDSTNKVQNKLDNTISLISKIAQIKSVPKEETVGYSRNGKLNKDSQIAIINIGYADGYNRRLGNGLGSVYVKNQFAPIVGNICMDMIMIDITSCKNISVGDEVELIGAHISSSDLAEKLGTIPYEIITSISSRVQRVYWED